jgi:Na+/proline symporter
MLGFNNKPPGFKWHRLRFWLPSTSTTKNQIFRSRRVPATSSLVQVFFFFCFLTNVIVSAMLILGGAAVMTALTGMSTYAAAFLIPVSVCIYTAAGGLKGTACHSN